MIKDLKAAMTASISEVLETMFYMPLEFEDQGDALKRGILNAPDLVICKLDFKGKLSGHFIMIIPENVLISMARDFMGEDRNTIKRIHTEGIIKEVVNMVVGHMFSTIDDTNDFHLGIPQIIENGGILKELSENIPESHVVAESIEGFIVSIVQLND